MKSLKFILLLLLPLCTFAIQCKPVGAAGQNAKEAAVKKLLESRMYQFIPQSVQPQAGRSIPISNYALTIRKESMSSYLPYFGVAHSAPINTGKGPLDFKATNFAYSSEAGNRGNTLVSIKLDNATDAQEFNFTVSATGYATLNVRFNSRQSISFYGQIRSIPPERKRR
jgi:hypothetical protein